MATNEAVLQAIESFKAEVREQFKELTCSVKDHETRLTKIESDPSLKVEMGHVIEEIREIKKYWSKVIMVLLLSVVGLAGGPKLVEAVAKAIAGF